MAQYDFGTIDPNTKSGTALATDLNSWRNALHSTHSGSTAPSYLVAGMLWADTTSANYELKMYDGAQWIQVAVIDATNNVARVAVDSAETSYITATTAAQIKHVIAGTDTMTIRATGMQFNIASPVISDSSNNELVSFTETASAVNQINLANAATGNAPVISALGSDTNIDLTLSSKGTGVVTSLVETAATNTVIDVARVEARSSGTPATGIGTGLLFVTETAANNFEIGARIEAITTDVTGGSEDFDLSFKVMAAGAAATEVMRIKSTGTVDVDALSIAGVAASFNLDLLGTLTTTSGTTQTLSGLTLTSYKALLVVIDGVSHDNGSARNLRLSGNRISDASATGTATFDGFAVIALTSGRCLSTVGNSTVTDTGSENTASGITTSSTSMSFTWDGTGNFDAGKIHVWGIK